MTECELARGLRVELEDARRQRDSFKEDALDAIKERDEAIRQRDEAIKERDYERDAYKNMRDGALKAIEKLESDLQVITKERDALREEIARRDAEKPVTALSWIEKTDARIDKIDETIRLIGKMLDRDASNLQEVDERISKLEARVSKKRVKK